MRLKDRKTLSIPKAARRAGVEPATVLKWLESGKLKGTKSGTRKQSRWRIAVRAFDILLERNVNQTTRIEQEYT